MMKYYKAREVTSFTYTPDNIKFMNSNVDVNICFLNKCCLIINYVVIFDT